MLSIFITKHGSPKIAFIVKLTKHFTWQKGNVKITSLLKRHYTNWTILYIFENFLNILNRFQSYVHLYIILQLQLYNFILLNILFDSVHNMKQHICDFCLFVFREFNIMNQNLDNLGISNVRKSNASAVWLTLQIIEIVCT